MASALLNTETDAAFRESSVDSDSEAETVTGRQMASAQFSRAEPLRLQAAECLAAHRSRRGAAVSQPAGSAGERARGEVRRTSNTRAARIAAAVAERYANATSYRAFLAAEAERAIRQARAAAEVAALNAQVVTAAQQRLLEEFDRQAEREDEDARRGELKRGELERSDSAGCADMRHAQPEQSSAVELNLWPDLEPVETPVARASDARASETSSTARRGESTASPGAAKASPPAGASAGGFTVRLYEDSAIASRVDLGARQTAGGASRSNWREHRNGSEARSDAEVRALDEEIAFRQAPVFEEPAGPPMPLPANLIEFPRQLVAARKARPRYAEGPLRDEDDAAPGGGQLRIFEVDPALISTTPAADADADVEDTPQWTSIWLDTPWLDTHDRVPTGEAAGRATAPGEDAVDSFTGPDLRAVPPLQPASIGRRLLAAAINSCVMLAGLLGFAAVFVLISGHALHWPGGGPLGERVRQFAGSIAIQTGIGLGLVPLAAAVAGGFLYLLYQALFFTFSEATPGMRCARIALCTFDDENPTRPAMRLRILAVLLSACPLGLGLLWATLDEERLTWHDRMSRMYQRSY